MAGFQAVAAFFISFLVVALITPSVRKFALQWKLGDKPNGRKIDTRNVPHVGGVGIVLGTVVSLVVVAFATLGAANGVSGFLLRLAVPVVIIVALGLTDDMKNLGALQKLVVQILSAVVLALSGIHLLTGVQLLDGNAVFAVVLTTVYIVGMSSSLNLIDGHDGLAAGLSAISAAAFAILAQGAGAQPMLFLSLALAGACGGFLIFNFPPGKIFMGDTGSMFLGTILGAIACGLTMLQPAISTFFAVCFILSIPMIDSLLAIVRRLVLRRPVFQADCLHIHHLLSSFGFSARQTLLILYLMQATMALLGILVMKGFLVPLILGIVVLGLLFLVFIRVMVSSSEIEQQRSADFNPASIPSLEKK